MNLGLIFLLALTGLATVNSLFQTRRAIRLRRQNAKLQARLLMRGDDGGLSHAEMAARVMADLVDATGPVADAANGARRQREAEGWSPTAAEQMGHTLYMLGLAKLTGMIMSADGE